jgi:hypothetical protein
MGIKGNNIYPVIFLLSLFGSKLNKMIYVKRAQQQYGYGIPNSNIPLKQPIKYKAKIDNKNQGKGQT